MRYDPTYIPKLEDNYTVVTLFRLATGTSIEIVVEGIWLPSRADAFVSRYFAGWRWGWMHYHAYKHTHGVDEVYDVTPIQNEHIKDVE